MEERLAAQSRESSLIECEETANSTRSCLCVHFQRKVQETPLLHSRIAFRYRLLPSARLPGKVFRQRGLIDNRLRSGRHSYRRATMGSTRMARRAGM